MWDLEQKLPSTPEVRQSPGNGCSGAEGKMGAQCGLQLPDKGGTCPTWGREGQHGNHRH